MAGRTAGVGDGRGHLPCRWLGEKQLGTCPDAPCHPLLGSGLRDGINIIAYRVKKDEDEWSVCESSYVLSNIHNLFQKSVILTVKLLH